MLTRSIGEGGRGMAWVAEGKVTFLTWVVAGGSEGEHSKEKRAKKTQEGEEKEGFMVVGKRKPH